MCNLHEWANPTWSVSVKNERLSGFMTDSLSERMAGLPVAQKASSPPLNRWLANIAVNEKRTSPKQHCCRSLSNYVCFFCYDFSPNFGKEKVETFPLSMNRNKSRYQKLLCLLLEAAPPLTRTQPWPSAYCLNGSVSMLAENSQAS